jgi:hypothetical protein
MISRLCLATKTPEPLKASVKPTNTASSHVQSFALPSTHVCPFGKRALRACRLSFRR